MPINANAYNPKPTAEDWDWAWDKIINEMQINYIDTYQEEISKKSNNQHINSANEAKSEWIDQYLDDVKNPSDDAHKTDGARWLAAQIYLDEPDYPYTRKEPTLSGIENMLSQIRYQQFDTLKAMKDPNPFA